MRTSTNMLAAALVTAALVSLSACGQGSAGGAESGSTPGASRPSAPKTTTLTSLMSQKGYQDGSLFLKMSDDDINSIRADGRSICKLFAESQVDNKKSTRASDAKLSLLMARLAEQADNTSIKTVLGSMSSVVVAKKKDQMGYAFALMGEWPAMTSACRTLGVKVPPLSTS